MTFVRPSYSELKIRLEADLAAMPAVLRAPLSASLARVAHGEYEYLAWAHTQCSPLGCDLQRLTDWAGLYGVDRLVAVAAAGMVVVAGVDGAMVPVNALVSSASGVDYEVTATGVLVDGDALIPVRCVTAGSVGNLPAGAPLLLADPVVGVDTAMVVGAGGLVGGADEEAVDAWRIRVVDEWTVVGRRGGRSGKPEDYRFWAKAAHPSVTDALVQLHTLGVGTVVVRPYCNALPNRLPTQAIVDAVAARLEEIAPAAADWRVAAPILRPVEVSIALLAEVDTPAIRAAIVAALDAMVKADTDGALTLGEIDAAIATVTSQYSRSAPLANVVAEAGELFALAPVVFV